MTNLLTAFELLLQAGKLQEAKKMLGELARRDLTPKEKDEAKILQERLHIKLINAINGAYIDTLDASIAQLKQLQTKSRAFFEKVKLAKTRAELSK
jgi:outer membrane PBP1 activator LpoA protein